MLLIFLIIFLTVGIYLNRSYAYFYDFLGQKNLVPTAYNTTIMLGNQSNQIIKYVALGDSLTAGVGVSDYKNSYPYLIAQKLSAKFNVELINLSHTGDTSSDMLIKLPQVLSQKPDLITLLIGINDIHNLKSLKEFKDNYTQIVSALKISGAKIYLLSIPYLGSEKIVFWPYNFILDFRTRQFNNIIRKTAEDIKIGFVDLYSLKKPADFYSSDQFHPSEAGYKEWAKVINVN